MRFTLRVSAAIAMALACTACGGGSVIAPPPIASSGPVTFDYTPGLVPCCGPYSISVQPGGSATKMVNGAPLATVQLTAALTTQIFSDVQRAWPLSKLTPNGGIPDTGALTVSWSGEVSPNIVDASSGIESALDTDARNVSAAFGP